MTETTTCPQCGSPLSAHAVHGICPRCLLQAGFESRPIPPAGATDQPTFVAGTPAAPQPEEVAALFPQLEILELLGRGGMGAVYKARQRDLHRIVALKILPPEMARDPSFGERFIREARALASLNHPQIVTIYDFGQAQGVYYLLMEYVDGVNLRQAQQAGHIEPGQVLGIISQICEALQYAHEEGVVHRDIKPENILLDRRGRVKIADFGLAKLVRNQPADLPLTQTQQVMGTLHYMAPEQLEHPLQVDHRADIFSLGVVFYELLTGELPLGRFETPSHKVQIDVRLDEIVLRALERNPERRYQWASQVKTELDTVSHTPGPRPLPAATPPVPASTEQGAVANRLRIPAIGLCIIGALSCAVPVGMVVAFLVVSLSRPQVAIAGLGMMELILACACVPVGALLIVGSLQMLRLNSYSWAMAAAILGVFPCAPFFFISLPLSIWALFVLSQDETQAAFEQRRRQRLVRPLSADAQIHLTGIGLLLSGVLQLLCGLCCALAIPWIVVVPANATPTFLAMGLFLLFGFACLVCSALMIAGGVQMLGRGSWGLAKAGAIAALIPLGPWWLITFPCGLCALLALHAPGARERFRSSGSAHAVHESSARVVGPAQLATARTRMLTPAVGMLAAAVLQVVFTFYLMNAGPQWDPHGLPRWLLVIEMLSLSASLAMIAGAAQMLAPGSIGLAQAGAIAGMLPFGPSWMIGFPSGIWALVVLHRADVRMLFRNGNALPDVQQPAQREADSWEGGGGGPPGTAIGNPEDWAPEPPAPGPPPAAKLKLMGVIGIVAILAAIVLSIRPLWNYALLDAAQRGDAARIRTLLKFSQEVNIRDKEGMTPLMRAARNGHVLAVRALTPYASVDEPDSHGVTALMDAAMSGQVDAVHALLDAHGDVNRWSRAGDTALMFAARNGAWDMIVAMRQRGADPATQNGQGETALMLAAAGGHVSAVDALLREDISDLPGSRYGSKPRDAVINLRSEHGETALVKAVLAKNAEIVRRLLEAKADPNEKRADGETALAIAVGLGDDELIAALLKGGATPIVALELRRAYRVAVRKNFKDAQPLLEKALQDFPEEGQPCRFRVMDWNYEVPDSRRLLQLLLADCAFHSRERDRLNEILEQVLSHWSEDNYAVTIYQRTSAVPELHAEETYGVTRSSLEGWRTSAVHPNVQYKRSRRERRGGQWTGSRGEGSVSEFVQ